MVTTEERLTYRIIRDTQRGIAELEEGLTLMRQRETREAYALLSDSWVELLERRRREIAERFLPTLEELTQAHEKFLEDEPRDLSYRFARWLLSQTENGTAPFTTAEVTAAFLFTWNADYYRNRPKEKHKGLEGLERLLCQHGQKLQEFRHRTIETLTEEDGEAVREVFAGFCEVLKPVGAAKALHLLSPNFFPLWDNEISKAYGLPRREKATPQDDARRCWQFMQVVKWQVKLLRERYGEQLPEFARQNLLKALDEWNYAKFTKG